MKVLAFALVAAVAASLLPASRTASAQELMTLPIDGIHCDASEGVVEHIHAHLQIFYRGRRVGIPAGVGIPDGAGCLYWLHTHTPDGIIHIESPIRRTFTLGQFFDIWNQTLSPRQAAGAVAPPGKRLAVWVDGKRYAGNPRSIVLHDREEIVIQSGPPYGRPVGYDWSQL